MNNLFGEEWEAPTEEKKEKCENKCGEEKKKPAKKQDTKKAKSKLDEELPSKRIQVKMYNDFYLYEAPAELEKPTLEHVRSWMINQHGFSELVDPNRAGLMIVKPEKEGEDPYIYCGVKFEKMG